MNIYFGEKLKELRSKRNLTQEKLADFFGVSFQTISKWERGETYPDITMLPAIASFFAVSCDELLEVDAAKAEMRVNEYINGYSRLWSEHKLDEVKALMKQAIEEFPGNYDLLSRYFNALIQAHCDNEYKLKINNEVQQIYDRIQNYCTDDKIRVWTKKMMCKYLRDMSLIEGSGIDISAAEKILDEMPAMQNTRDYEAIFLYVRDKQKRDLACANGVSELLRLLAEVIQRKYDNPTEYDENVIESFLNFINTVMPNGDYGKSFINVIYDYGYLGVKKHLNGKNKEAMECFKRSAELAKKFDKLPAISTHTSFLLEGLIFDKTKTYIGTDKAQNRVKFLLLNKYPLSDEFKASAEFKEILDMLE